LRTFHNDRQLHKLGGRLELRFLKFDHCGRWSAVPTPTAGQDANHRNGILNLKMSGHQLEGNGDTKYINQNKQTHTSHWR
jgi:hypothetical protein